MNHPAIPIATGERRVWLRVGTLLDGLGGSPQLHADVVYDGGGILAVGRGASQTAGRDAPDLTLPDYTLLPGLIEAHAHLFLEGGELNLEKRAAWLMRSPATLLEAAKGRLGKLARLGVIAVRDAGDKEGVGLALSKLYASAERPLMPYLDSPGAAIHHRGRYGGFMGEAMEIYSSPRECVESRIKAGADRIKLIPTGIINFKAGAVTTEPQMTTEEVRAFVQAAGEFGRQTFAHASGDKGIERALEGGVDSIEHGFFIRYDQLARMRDRQIAWVPTFAPVREQLDHATEMGWDDVVSHLKRILDQHAARLMKGLEMGVVVIAGSDAGSCGVAHGHGFLRELELMEEAGASASAVVHAATGASSNRLGFKEQFGQIKPGYRSRFILTRHSPLEGIGNLSKPKIVVFDGAVLDQPQAGDEAGM